MEKQKFGAIYEAQCHVVGDIFRERALKLWQDVKASEWGDTVDNWFVPEENRKEAERRVHFVNEMLKKYTKMFHSKQKVYHFIHNLNAQLKKKEERLKFLKNQVAMDFVDTETEITALEEEIKEIQEIKYLIKNSKSYFTAPHFSST